MWRIALASLIGAYVGYLLAHLFIGGLEMTFGQIVFVVLVTGGAIAWLVVEIVKFIKFIKAKKADNKKKSE